MLCFFGLHKYEHDWLMNGWGYAIGLRCKRCKVWHKTAEKGGWSHAELSNCCSAPITEPDICSECKEHCEGE